MVRFGISAFRARSGSAWRELARRVEGHGFDVLYVPDHVGFFDPFPALVAAAAVTDRLRVGTYVLNAAFWNPLLLARAAITTDVLSDGRLILGLGAGHAQVEFEQAGLRYPTAGERVGRLERVIPALRRLLAGGGVTDNSLGLRDARTGLDAREIPLLVGGNGDRVLRLAAGLGDRVGLTGFTAGSGQHHSDLSHWSWSGLANRLDVIHRAAGARHVEVDLLVQRVEICEDRERIANEMAELTGTPSAAHLDSPFLLIGTHDEIRAQLSRLERLGVAQVTVFAAFADKLASAAGLSPSGTEQ